MKALLIGGHGQLGADLARTAGDRTIVAPARGALDVTDAAAVRAAIAAGRPDVVINCAAFHNVPLCEDEPARAFLVNAIAVRDLARACAERGTRLVTFSSDYVFGGDARSPWAEEAMPAPLQVYGATRLAGEHFARAEAPDRTIVIRTCGLYGAGGARSKGGNFVDNRVAEARAGQDLDMASEQVVSPTATHDLAVATWQLLDAPAVGPGLYHLVNEGACSWHEFASEIFRLVGARGTVRPVDRGARTGAMRRPRYSALANTRARALGVTLRPWREALAAYLRQAYPELVVA
ncbi:MAG: dTDP-4-dehydrorhamnose reductase [Gemmatimonadetes bacterium]|nr:dTDP-4-dehydrorhamnose reductase [Gemmatimonadota bacterium]